jgi:glycosyltransferase involved in cell wall biosynthesis
VEGAILSVLCITDQAGFCPSFRSRVLAFIPLLAKKGIQIIIRESLPDNLNFDAIWLHRTTLSEEELERINVPFLYEFDDATYLFPIIPALSFNKTVQRAQIVLAGSSYLLDQAIARGAKDVRILRTGLDIQTRSLSKQSDPFVLVWTGSVSTLMFLQSIEFDLWKLVERHGIKLRIISDRFPSWNFPFERFTWHPSTEKNSMSDVNIGLAPLIDNPYSRGKCAYKIIQYMAHGLPVIASKIGGNQEIFDQYGCKGSCIDKPDFYGSTLRLLSDKHMLASMGEENRKIAEEHFDLKILVKTLSQALMDLA